MSSDKKQKNKKQIMTVCNIVAVDDHVCCGTVVHMQHLHGHHTLPRFGGGLNVDTSAPSSKSA